MVGITQQQFQVKLRSNLVADDQSFVAVPLQDAIPRDMARFKPSLDGRSHVQTGVIALGPSIKISVALVKLTEAKKCLYYDPAGSGTFAPNQRVCFQGVTNRGNYADEAKVELPIRIGPYSKIPLILHTLRPEDPAKPVSVPLLFYSSQILVEGMASIDGRKVPLAYRLNLSRGGPLTRSAQRLWMRTVMDSSIAVESGRLVIRHRRCSTLEIVLCQRSPLISQPTEPF
jgi:hypothetical protein